MSGSIADYDALCEALDAYEAGIGSSGDEERYMALRIATTRCGRSKFELPIAFARRRVSTYRAHIAQVSGLVEHINNVIQQEMSK